MDSVILKDLLGNESKDAKTVSRFLIKKVDEMTDQKEKELLEF
jgi:ribosome recycling factor